MLAHALYRSRRFADSVAYLEQAQALLAAGPGRQFSEFGPRFTFLLAANYAFLRRNADSIAAARRVLRDPKPLATTRRPDAALPAHLSTISPKQPVCQSQPGPAQPGPHRPLAGAAPGPGVDAEPQHRRGADSGRARQHRSCAIGRLRAIERTIREQFPAVAATGADAAGPVPAGGPYQPVLVYLAPGAGARLRTPACRSNSRLFVQPRDRTCHPSSHEEREDLQVHQLLCLAARPASLGNGSYYEVLLELAHA